MATALPASDYGSSLRFFGNGVAAPTLDRVVIPLDGPHRPVDIGGQPGDAERGFTLELWLRADPDANASTAVCHPGADAWIAGNIVLDRDVFGPGDHGDYGLSLMAGEPAFGVHDGSDGATVCGSADLRDDRWHHLALTRDGDDGELRIWLDGSLHAGPLAAPDGDLAYRDGRLGGAAWDAYLVLGAEKHDAGPAYPSFAGWLDDLRLSRGVRYAAAFTPPLPPLAADGTTAALYRADEGTGTTLGDAAGGGASWGTLRLGGSPAGPRWSGSTPRGFSDGFESGTLQAWDAWVP